MDQGDLAPVPDPPAYGWGCLLLAVIVGILLIVAIVPSTSGGTWHGEYVAKGALRTIHQSQIWFRDQDADKNGVADYWLDDVAGLYFLQRDGEPIRLLTISTSLADANPKVQGIPADQPRHPQYGYWFEAVPIRGRAPGDRSAYAVQAYPDRYRSGGRYTYVIFDTGEVHRKDLGKSGRIEGALSNPPGEGWERVER